MTPVSPTEVTIEVCSRHSNPDVTDYLVSIPPTGSGLVCRISATARGVMKCTIGGLDGGTEYEVHVKACANNATECGNTKTITVTTVPDGKEVCLFG